MNLPEFSPEEFGAAFQRFMMWAEQTGEARPSPFATMLTEHFGADPSEYPVTTEAIATHDLPNLQLGLDALLGLPDVEFRLTGFAGPVGHFELSLTGLVHDESFGIRLGPVRRRVVELDGGSRLPCVTSGLYLVRTDQGPLALLVAQGQPGFGQSGFRLEVIGERESHSEDLVERLRSLMSQRNVYRGKVLALGGSGDFGDEDMAIHFRDIPEVQREDIVLPEGILDVVELHTVDFATHADKLLAGGRHIRRGLLLHGPPGTGKTLTVEYLIKRLEGRTVVVLSGSALGMVEEACALARNLAPAMVVLEDVDLVAQERMMEGPTSLLFELMNQIDGIGADSDVIFLMTTNRADVLEPALAARPGRVDQAVEIPLPDDDARHELLHLYLKGLEVDLQDPRPIVEATEGVSAAFIRELVRKAALLSAHAGDASVGDGHFAAAMDLLDQGGQVTRAMLGGDGGKTLEDLDDEDDDWGPDWGPHIEIR